MTIHENQLFHLTEAEIDEITALVKEDPDMEPVFNLATLRDHYKAECDTADRLHAQTNKLKVEHVELRDRRDATQKVHDTLGERVRLTEDKAFNTAMNAKGIEKVRLEHGGRTGKVVRRCVIEKLGTKPEYQGWMQSLGELQSELDAFPGAMKKLEARVKEAGDIANAQSRKAGDVLLAIRELEAVLDA